MSASSPASFSEPAASASGRRARLIAFYLPQYHPIPENDRWWGAGFTEWTNVARARPLFRGHHQPNLPADLGFYDLRVPETRAAQAALAAAAGIEGFCYWHYWFAGKQILERPFNEVLSSGEPDFPFCLGWANQSWTGIWHASPEKILIEQTYPGRDDHERHFHAILPALLDRRHLRVNDRPVFLIFRPTELPRAGEMIELWQQLAARNGLPGVHFIAHSLAIDPHDYRADGFAGAVYADTFRVTRMNAWQRALRLARAGPEPDVRPLPPLARLRALARAVELKARKHWYARPRVFAYREAMLYFLDSLAEAPDSYPCVVPNWDNSPRTGRNALVFHDSTPDLFQSHLRSALRLAARRPFDERLVFVKSWNEWAEGNYLEPDARHGRGFLDAVRAEAVVAAP